MLAATTDLERTEFAAFADRSELAPELRWALPFALFAAQLDRARTVLDRSPAPGALDDAIGRLYRRVAAPAAGEAVDRVLYVEALDGATPAARATLVREAAELLAPGGVLVVAGPEDCAAIEPLCAEHGLTALPEPDAGVEHEPLVVAGRRLYGRVFARGATRPAAPERAAVAFAILSWNTCEIVVETLAACAREARTLARLGHETVLIVCDNGSTDGTPEALRALADELDVPLQLLCNPENRGISVARNQMIDVALGLGVGFLLLLDGDIEPVPLSTYSLLRHLEDSSPQVGLAWPNIDRFATRREHATPLLLGVSPATVVSLPSRVFAGYMLLRSAVFAGGVRFDDSEVFSGHGYGFEDMDFGFQLHVAGFESHCVDAITFLHRYPNSSIDVMRKLGVDARATAIRRKQHLLRKWQDVPLIADGPLELVRGTPLV